MQSIYYIPSKEEKSTCCQSGVPCQYGICDECIITHETDNIDDDEEDNNG